MHFDTSVTPSQLSKLRPKFVAITGWAPWNKRINSLKAQLRQNPLLQEYLEERHLIEFEMEKLQQRVRAVGTIRLPRSYEEYKLYSFMAMITRVYQQLKPQGRRRLQGMLRSGPNNNNGLVPVQHEMTIVSHLMDKGFDVTLTDIEDVERFDFLAIGNGVELEVECKTHSADIGRKIHKRRLIQLGERAYENVCKVLEERHGCHYARITLPSRLEGSDKQQEEISKRLCHVLRTGASVLDPEPCAIEYRPLVLSGTPFGISGIGPPEEERLRRYLLEEFGDVNSNSFVIGSMNGVVVVTVVSAQPDHVVEGIMRQIKDSMKTQFTRKRPALMCVGLSEITEEQMLEIARMDHSEDQSALGRSTECLLQGQNFAHVHAVSYCSTGRVMMRRVQGESIETTAIHERGLANVYYNPIHKLRNDIRLRVFPAYP